MKLGWTEWVKGDDGYIVTDHREQLTEKGRQQLEKWQAGER